MRQGTRKGLITVMAATGALAATSGYAHADAGAGGTATHSPGVLSGNTVQVPVHVPVNVCGNTVNIIGVLNPAVGNACTQRAGAAAGGHGDSGGAHTGGRTDGSPGVGSGNTVQVPIDVPVNVCGNSVDVIGAGNAATGNDCANGTGGGHETPPGGGHETPPGGGHETPPGGGHENPPGGGRTTPPGNPGHPSTPGTPPAKGGETPAAHTSHIRPQGDSSVTRPDGAAQLAHTGSGLPIDAAVPLSAGALLAGAVLYRKARAAA
ncbi:chaplin family protein [Streptomyces sp. NPDC001508]|uniref:chaplin n=1 Tax=Streptomyces sp. NPDC001508 TaxID=3154656 RepID=UPI00331A5CD5